MARRNVDADEDDPRDEEGDPASEEPGLVGRLLRTGVSAPNVAMKLLADQVAGWKKDFLGIFQAEIRRFLDRQDAGAELRKLIEGKRLEVSIRLVDDREPSGSGAAPRDGGRGRAGGRGSGRKKR